MISLYAVFWVMIIFFAFIGAMRGWSKEVIAMSGLILALFTIDLFGELLVRLLSGVGGAAAAGDVAAEMRRQFIVLGSIFIVIAFFSYQSVALVRARIGARAGFQERLLGLIFGAVNGYLVIGTLWGLLEYKITVNGWEKLPDNFPYAFDPLISRPEVNTAVQELIITHLPSPWLVPWLPILLVLIFLFVIIVII